MNLMQDQTLEFSDEPAIQRITWKVEVSRENLVVATLSSLLGNGLMLGIGIYLIELGPAVIVFVLLAALSSLVSFAILVDAWFGAKTEFIELTDQFLIVSHCFPHDILALHETNAGDFFSTMPWARRRRFYSAQSIKSFRLDCDQGCYAIVCELRDHVDVNLLKTKSSINAKRLHEVLCEYLDIGNHPATILTERQSR